MKIWRGYGSEHSSNLVLIGRFKTVADAVEAKRIMERLTEQVRADVKAGLMDESDPPQRFTDHIMELFKEVETYIVAPAELSQFNYEFSVKLQGDTIVLTTEEYDVSAFLKILVNGGARVEVFSRHDYPAAKETAEA
ncbi:MAG TPA: DUF6375 family protein [Terriglobia bacterium]|nr:DUF6375 family protein [Terriglobia bacterium]